MIILDSTTRKLEVLLSGAVATTQLPFVAHFVELSTTIYGPASTHGVTNGASPVVLVGSPPVSTQRQIKLLTVQNADTAVATVTVRYNDNGVTRDIVKISLAVNDTLEYTDGDGWAVIESTGSRKTGVTGPKGDTGTVGGTGVQGSKGDTGATGGQGSKGDTGSGGSAGASGDTGTAGVKGDTGSAGTTGGKGDTGADSTVAGPKGDTGTTGSQGIQGDTGVQGTAGQKGDTGSTGSQGSKGDTGTTGSKGDTGTAGGAGAKGDTGASGGTGAKGDTGTSGGTGAKGDTGTSGARQLSAVWQGVELPVVTGAGVVWVVPKVGGVSKTFNLNRAILRLDTPGTTTTTIRVQKSAGGGAFSPTDVATLTVTSGVRDAEVTTSLGQLTSGNLVRLSWDALGGGASTYLVQLEGTEA